MRPDPVRARLALAVGTWFLCARPCVLGPGGRKAHGPWEVVLLVPSFLDEILACGVFDDPLVALVVPKPIKSKGSFFSAKHSSFCFLVCGVCSPQQQ